MVYLRVNNNGNITLQARDIELDDLPILNKDVAEIITQEEYEGLREESLKKARERKQQLKQKISEGEEIVGDDVINGEIE